MLNIAKYYVYDENHQPVAVQISISDFERLEELLENHGLSKLMDEAASDELLTGKTAFNYYESLKNGMDG